MREEGEQRLYDQLIKLGDMMGDGMHHEPGGRWIEKEYRKICHALGLSVGLSGRRANHSEQINAVMAERIKEVTCQKCAGELKQTRSGSMRATCVLCGTKFQLMRIRKKTKGGAQ